MACAARLQHGRVGDRDALFRFGRRRAPMTDYLAWGPAPASRGPARRGRTRAAANRICFCIVASAFCIPAALILTQATLAQRRSKARGESRAAAPRPRAGHTTRTNRAPGDGRSQLEQPHHVDAVEVANGGGVAGTTWGAIDDLWPSTSGRGSMRMAGGYHHGECRVLLRVDRRPVAPRRHPPFASGGSSDRSAQNGRSWRRAALARKARDSAAWWRSISRSRAT